MTANAIGTSLGRVHKILGESTFATYIVIKIRNQCDAVIRARLSDGPSWESNGEMLLLRQVAPKVRYFVDVGANVGAWSRSCAALMAHDGAGLLFEPSPETASRARANLQQYASRLEIVEAAVGDSVGETTFFAEPDFGETSSVVRSFARPEAAAVNVRLTTLDRELDVRAVEYVDFLKVDAEGCDFKVLKGAKHALEKGRIGIAQFEYNAAWAVMGSTLVGAMNFLDDCGYKMFLLKADGLHKLNYRKYGEYFGYSNYVAISPQWEAITRPLIRNDI